MDDDLLLDERQVDCAGHIFLLFSLPRSCRLSLSLLLGFWAARFSQFKRKRKGQEPRAAVVRHLRPGDDETIQTTTTTTNDDAKEKEKQRSEGRRSEREKKKWAKAGRSLAKPVLVADPDELAGKRAHSQRLSFQACSSAATKEKKQSRCFQTRQVFCLHLDVHCDAATDSIVRRAGALHPLEALFSTRTCL